MKSSIHLLYGIIIGILLFACTGSIKKDKAEFETEEIYSTFLDSPDLIKSDITKLKKDGWTIIDWEIAPDGAHNFHIGK